MAQIHGYHAHVYFDEGTFEQATALCDEIGRRFKVEVGRKHRRLVGPHPSWSCQLAFAPAQFGEVIPYLALNRKGLTVFIHALTGDDLKDHTDHTLWMGPAEPLKLAMFTG